jgi:hypothetical protein
MPLSEMYRTMLEANNPATWEKNRQSELMGQMLLQEKQQQLDEASRLRELFSRGGMPSEEAMFAASPATAMKYRESQNKQMKDFIEMQKAQQDIASSQFKLNAEQETLLGQAHGAVVDAFDQLIAQGIPKDKAIQIVTPYAGQLTSHLSTIGVRTGQSFDPKNINEDSIENMRLSARRSKYPLMSDKTLQEAQLKSLPTYQDINPQPIWDAQRGQFINRPSREMPDFSGASATELNALEGALKGMAEGPEKEGLKRFLAEKKGMPSAQAPTGLADVGAIEAETEKKKERAKLNVQDEQDAENKLSTIASMPSDDELMKYLNDATVGKAEEVVKGPVASFFHVENAAQAADTVLDVLQQNIKNIATKAKGDMNIQEVKAYDAAVGALNNKELGPQARFQAYMVAKNMAVKKIAMKHPEIAKKYGMGTATQGSSQQQEAPEGTKKPITFSDGAKGEAIMTNGKWEAHRL